MIAINVEKMKMSLARLKQVNKRIADTADGIYRQKIYWLAKQAVLVSPQWSGDFASNWNLAVDGNMPVYKPWPGKFESRLARHDDQHTGAAAYRVQPHQAGDPEAVTTSVNRVANQLKGVTRANRVHIVNATGLKVGDTGTTMHGPDGVERLRPENVIPTGTRIEIYVRAQAEFIPANLPNPEST